MSKNLPPMEKWAEDTKGPLTYMTFIANERRNSFCGKGHVKTEVGEEYLFIGLKFRWTKKGVNINVVADFRQVDDNERY